MRLKTEKVCGMWKVFKIETCFGKEFKTLVGEGKTKFDATRNAHDNMAVEK